MKYLNFKQMVYAKKLLNRDADVQSSHLIINYQIGVIWSYIFHLSSQLYS